MEIISVRLLQYREPSKHHRLSQCLRRWPNTNPTLVQCLVIVGKSSRQVLAFQGGDRRYTSGSDVHRICFRLWRLNQRDPLGWDIFNVVNFENLIYMKLYSLLILTEQTKKSKNNFKAPKKSEIVVFPGRILPCKQNKSAIFSILHLIFPRIRR